MIVLKSSRKRVNKNCGRGVYAIIYLDSEQEREIEVVRFLSIDLTEGQ